MLIVQARVSITVKNHQDKNKVGRKGFVWLTLPYHCSPLKEVRQELTQSRNLEAGVDAEAMGGGGELLIRLLVLEG